MTRSEKKSNVYRTRLWDDERRAAAPSAATQACVLYALTGPSGLIPFVRTNTQSIGEA